MIQLFTNKLFIKLILTTIIFFGPINKFKLEGDPLPTPQENQNEFPRNYFRWPMDIPIELLGTFGELRPNHFHSGIDIRTQQREGIPIYSVADGYVSRIRIQASGFGNALYITHPNGYVSVYAHLKNFSSPISSFIRKIQYRLKSFEVDTLLPKNLIQIKKSQQIANSGNTGASQGPHLHFDIRDERTQEPLNFLKFFPVLDTRAPTIGGIYIYPLSNTSKINGLKNKVRLMHNGGAKASGEIGFGIVCDDGIDGSSSRNGVYSIELFANGKRIYFSQMDRFSFDHTRKLNAHIDYKEKLTSGKTIQKSFISPGNNLTIYKELENSGKISLQSGKYYQFKYIVKDAAGNKSEAIVNVLGMDEIYSENLYPKIKNDISWNKDFNYSTENFKLMIPANTLYEDASAEFNEKDDAINLYSKTISILNKFIPANSNFFISIKINENLPSNSKDKLYIHQIGKGYCGGTYDNGYVQGLSKYFGDFQIAIDNKNPSINPINIFNGKLMHKNNGIIVRIFDKESGIKKYNGKIDGNWVLMNYDQKYQTLSYYWDENCPKGKHLFELEVMDNKNNKNKYTANFTR